MRCWLAVILLALPAAVAMAQLRTLPAHAAHGKIRHLQEMIVQIDGKQARLAPGAQVRDTHNRILVPTAIPAGSLVRYTVNPQGEIAAVWILTPYEASQLPADKPKPVPLPTPLPAK